MGFSIYIRIERGLDPDLNPGGKTIKQITPTRYFKQIFLKLRNSDKLKQ